VEQEAITKKAASRAWFKPVCCLTYSLTLKMEATCSFEMPVDFHWTTQRYNPEDRILYIFVCLFKDAPSNSNYIALNIWMIENNKLKKNVKGRGLGLI
jgi:hypothetical protein